MILISIIILFFIYRLWLIFQKDSYYATDKNMISNFKFLPAVKCKLSLTKETQDFIEKTIINYSLDKKLPSYKNGLPYTYVYIYTDPIEPNISVSAAHNVWNEAVFEKIPSPYSLPRQEKNSITPGSLIKVKVNCVREYCRNHWDYKGYFLSLLIEKNTGEIWDARGGTIDKEISS